MEIAVCSVDDCVVDGVCWVSGRRGDDISSCSLLPADEPTTSISQAITSFGQVSDSEVTCQGEPS